MAARLPRISNISPHGALERLVSDAPGQEDVLVVLRYILRIAGNAPYESLRQRIAQAAPALEEPMASAAQQLIDLGVARGVEKGVQPTLLRQLHARFGPVD